MNLENQQAEPRNLSGFGTRYNKEHIDYEIFRDVGLKSLASENNPKKKP